MTDLVTIAPLAIRHLRLPHIRFPKIGFGSTIASVSTGIRQAYCMAYVEPFNAVRRRPMDHDVVDLEGRDPNW